MPRSDGRTHTDAAEGPIVAAERFSLEATAARYEALYRRVAVTGRHPLRAGMAPHRAGRAHPEGDRPSRP